MEPHTGLFLPAGENQGTVSSAERTGSHPSLPHLGPKHYPSGTFSHLGAQESHYGSGGNTARHKSVTTAQPGNARSSSGATAGLWGQDPPGSTRTGSAGLKSLDDQFLLSLGDGPFCGVGVWPPVINSWHWDIPQTTVTQRQPHST